MCKFCETNKVTGVYFDNFSCPGEIVSQARTKILGNKLITELNNRVKPSDDDDDDYYDDNDTLYQHNFNACISNIKYCPYCGRKLDNTVYYNLSIDLHDSQRATFKLLEDSDKTDFYNFELISCIYNLIILKVPANKVYSLYSRFFKNITNSSDFDYKNIDEFINMLKSEYNVEIIKDNRNLIYGK